MRRPPGREGGREGEETTEREREGTREKEAREGIKMEELRNQDGQHKKLTVKTEGKFDNVDERWKRGKPNENGRRGGNCW